MVGGFFFLSISSIISWPLGALLIVMLLISIGSGLVERICIRPAIKQSGHNLIWILATSGLAIFISNTSNIIWSNIPLRIPEIIIIDPIKLGYLNIGGYEFLAILGGFIIVFLLRLFLYHSIIGKAIRVTAADHIEAELCGINSDKISLFVFMLSGVLGTISMVLIAPITFIKNELGFIIGLKGFAAATFGGLDNPESAYLGGIILGVAELLATFYLWSGFKDGVAFIAMIIIILLRPAGLFSNLRFSKRI